VEDADFVAGDGGGGAGGVDAVAGGFDAEHADVGVVVEGVEEAHGVGAAADAGDEGVGEASGFARGSGRALRADDALEVADDHGEGMGPTTEPMM
jgi:hypothetical protein